MNIKLTKTLLGLLAALSLAAPAAHATMIGFEDKCCGLLPADGKYAGFQWSGTYGNSSWMLGNSYGIGGAHSGSVLAWSNGGADLWIYGPTFTAESLWMRATANVAVTFTGYQGERKAFTTTALAGQQFEQVFLNFYGIDKLYIASGNRNLVLDDISASAIAEPASAALLLAGLGMIGLRRRARPG